MAQALQDPIEAGREAAARHDWSSAFELLQEARKRGELEPGDLEAFAEAGWWTANLDECIEARELAFAAYVESGEPGRAAFVGMELAKNYFAKGVPAIGMAWVKRAERLLADTPETVEHGWLHRLKSVMALEGAGDYESALTEARRAKELASRFSERDLLAIALHDEGRALVMRGDVDEGMALMDEATVPAVSGELTPFNTAVIYCNMITACKELADYRRAGDWSDAAKRWCERQSIAGFPGMCRVYRASVMALRGDWPEAELEARRACEELPAFNLEYAAAAFYELGELHLRTGDLVAAEEAFKQAHELGRDPQPGLALLRLAQDRLDGARRCLVQALDDEEGELHRARLLPAQVEVVLAAGDLAAARAASAELEGIASRFRTEALEASAEHALAQVALAEGDAGGALRHARQAFRLWQAIGAPYEAAQSRLLLAEAYAAVGAEDDAVLELEAAAATFERLGAAPAARTARELLARRATPAARPRRAAKTFMFTDVERSTKLVDAIGDDAWADLIRWHDQTLRSLFGEHGGEEVDHAGDGFFIAFDDAASALECAIAVQRRLSDHRRTHGFAPQVRIGIHTAEATRQAAGYKGKGVHEAARIGTLAGGGEIVSSLTAIEGNGHVAVSEPRRVELKGLEEPIEIVSVEWRS